MNEQGNVLPLDPSKETSIAHIPNQNQNQKGMISRSIKRKLIKTKVTLNQTLQKILEINKTRKSLPYVNDAGTKHFSLNEELKILNKIAAHQANLISKYEQFLSGNRRAS